MADKNKATPRLGGITGKGFVPGDPRINRKGSSPRILSRLLQEYLAEEDPKTKKKQARLIVEGLGNEAKAGNVKAIAEAFDRTEGKAPQPIVGMDASTLGDDALREEVKRILGLRKPSRKFRDEAPQEAQQ